MVTFMLSTTCFLFLTQVKNRVLSIHITSQIDFNRKNAHIIISNQNALIIGNTYASIRTVTGQFRPLDNSDHPTQTLEWLRIFIFFLLLSVSSANTLLRPSQLRPLTIQTPSNSDPSRFRPPILTLNFSYWRN